MKSQDLSQVRGEILEKFYTTSEVAKIIGIHPNTVRMYEDLELISKPMRKENGYRVFSDLHIDQFRVARIAFQIEVLQNGLRKKAVCIVKETARCNFDCAAHLTEEYLTSVQNEILYANQAVLTVKEILQGKPVENAGVYKRKQVSDLLGITMDTLRNWEMNGLLQVKRKTNGYRVYTSEDIQTLRIIRSLKCANYSLSAILRMMNALRNNGGVDIQTVLNTPEENEEIISVCDRLIVSLERAKENALLIKAMLIEMKGKSGSARMY